MKQYLTKPYQARLKPNIQTKTSLWQPTFLYMHQIFLLHKRFCHGGKNWKTTHLGLRHTTRRVERDGMNIPLRPSVGRSQSRAVTLLPFSTSLASCSMPASVSTPAIDMQSLDNQPTLSTLWSIKTTQITPPLLLPLFKNYDSLKEYCMYSASIGSFSDLLWIAINAVNTCRCQRMAEKVYGNEILLHLELKAN